MAFNYLFLETAQEEYESSVSWYLERSEAAAEQFVNSIDRTLELICDHPYRWRNEYKEYHELSMRTFPFSIVFTIEDERELVVITSVFHHKRNPRAKYKK